MRRTPGWKGKSFRYLEQELRKCKEKIILNAAVLSKERLHIISTHHTTVSVFLLYGFAILVCICSPAELCARTCILAIAKSAEQSAYARATPMASEARIVDTINSIIEGLSSSIAIPVRKMELEQFHGKKEIHERRSSFN
jgi:hypothetical protein